MVQSRFSALADPARGQDLHPVFPQVIRHRTLTGYQAGYRRASSGAGYRTGRRTIAGAEAADAGSRRPGPASHGQQSRLLPHCLTCRRMCACSASGDGACGWVPRLRCGSGSVPTDDGVSAAFAGCGVVRVGLDTREVAAAAGAIDAVLPGRARWPRGPTTPMTPARVPGPGPSADIVAAVGPDPAPRRHCRPPHLRWAGHR
jgi:hypothetical protein